MSEDQKQPARHAIHNLELYRNREAPWPNGALGVLKAFVDEASASPGPASDAELPLLPDRTALSITMPDRMNMATVMWDAKQSSSQKQSLYTADQMRAYGKECARAALASTRTASDTRTAAGEAECDAALGRAAPAGQHDAGDAADDEIVGHKTFVTEGGGFRHEPLRRGDADAIMAQVEARERRRAELMPDEAAARNMHFDAWLRLKELGWREAIYCPKDGTEFEVIEAGSTGIHRCIYSGEWPSGHWLILADGDAWPSRPVLYRSIIGRTASTDAASRGAAQGRIPCKESPDLARTQADAGKDASAAPSAEGE